MALFLFFLASHASRLHTKAVPLHRQTKNNNINQLNFYYYESKNYYYRSHRCSTNHHSSNSCHRSRRQKKGIGSATRYILTNTIMNINFKTQLICLLNYSFTSSKACSYIEPLPVTLQPEREKLVNKVTFTLSSNTTY